jgi:hypothetical protein
VTPLRTTVVSALALLALAYLAAIGLAGAETRGAAEGAVLDYASQAASAQYSQALYIFLNMALRAFPLVALLATVLVLVRVPRSRTPVLGLLVVGLIGLTLFANNPFAAPRMTFATFVIGFAAPFYLRRHRTAWGLAIIAVAGIALLPALHETRYVEKLDEVIDYVGLVSPLDYLATNSDVDSLGMTALVVRWLESHDYRLGVQSLGSLLFWFPRALWPGKPIETGAMVTRDLGFSFTNLAPPIQSDAIIDFGLLGVPFVAALYGLLFSRLDRCYWESTGPRQAVRVIDCIYPLWIGCVLFMTRGGSFAAFTFTSGFTAWVVLLGLRARQPAAPAPDASQRS